MSRLTDVPWPPESMTTGRLSLRATKSSDRPGYIELFSNDEVGRHVGGAQDRQELERAMPPVPGDRPGVFGVELADQFIGFVSLERRDASLQGHVRESASEVEIGYMFLPAWWGKGFATEAGAAVLDWASLHLPCEPIVLCTQAAHGASRRLAERLGFREVERFVDFGAEQWFGVRG
jgi:RimJ/RimL family protein N-acetyltransferase